MLRFTKERCSVKKAVKNTCPARVAAGIKGDPPHLGNTLLLRTYSTFGSK